MFIVSLNSHTAKSAFASHAPSCSAPIHSVTDSLRFIMRFATRVQEQVLPLNPARENKSTKATRWLHLFYKIIRRSKRTIHVLLSSRSLPAKCRKLKIRDRNKTIFYCQFLGTESRSVITLCILHGVLWKARVRNIGLESDLLARDPVRLEEALRKLQFKFRSYETARCIKRVQCAY